MDPAGLEVFPNNPPAKVAPGAAAAVARDPDQTWLLYVEFGYYKTVSIEVILSTV